MTAAERWWKEFDALAELLSFKLDVAALLEAHHNHYREGSTPAEAIAAIIYSRPQERKWYEYAMRPASRSERP